MERSLDSSYASQSLDPLPDNVRKGMIVMGCVGLLSTISTLSLLVFITVRMIYWRRFYAHPIATNQIFVLIYNLLLADFQQALSFLLAFYWISQNKLVGPSSVCFAQGWLIQIGDVSSGIWVLAIATHTFIGLVLQRKIPWGVFVGAVLVIWLFCLVLTAVGPIQERKDFFVPAGLWCWIGQKHERDRLTLHYLWIFMSQLGSLVMYLAIFFQLRFRLAGSIDTQRTLSSDPPTTPAVAVQQNFSKNTGTTTTVVTGLVDPFAVSRHRIMRTARYMIVYPFAYVILTLPLAAGRVASMAGREPSLIFFCVAGTMMASCGFVDVALYIYTRKGLVRGTLILRSGSDFPQHEDDNPLSPYPARNNNRDTWNDDSQADMNSSARGRLSGDTDSVTAENKVTIERGAIVVSKTVIRSEDHLDENPRLARSDSLRSLVAKKINL